MEIFDYPDSVHAFYNDARPEVFQPDNAAPGLGADAAALP